MKIIIACLIVLVCAGTVYAKWTYNPFTGKADYYQDLASDSGVTVPQPYQATPTVTSLRDLLVAAGIMSPAPTPSLPAKDYHFDDDTIGVHYENDDIGVHFDWDQ